MGLLEQLAGIVGPVVASGGVGAISAWMVARRRAQARVQVAEIEQQTDVVSHVFERLDRIEGKVHRCEEERDDCRRSLSDLRVEIARNFVPQERFERRVARIARRTLTDPRFGAPRADDSVEVVLSDEEVTPARGYPPPLPRPRKD